MSRSYVAFDGLVLLGAPVKTKVFSKRWHTHVEVELQWKPNSHAHGWPKIQATMAFVLKGAKGWRQSDAQHVYLVLPSMNSSEFCEVHERFMFFLFFPALSECSRKHL